MVNLLTGEPSHQIEINKKKIIKKLWSPIKKNIQLKKDKKINIINPGQYTKLVTCVMRLE